MWNININRSLAGDEEDDVKVSDKKCMIILMLMIMKTVNESYD
jgi:hypothetical protein